MLCLVLYVQIANLLCDNFLVISEHDLCGNPDIKCYDVHVPDYAAITWETFISFCIHESNYIRNNIMSYAYKYSKLKQFSKYIFLNIYF